MKSIHPIAFCFILALTGCQSAGNNASDRAAQNPLTMKPVVDAIPASAVGAQELIAGECGVFLWSKTDVSKFIFFSKALSGSALFAQGEVPVSMAQISAGGDIFGQFNTRMSYQTNDGRRLALTIEPGEVLEGGQRLESGLITVTDTEGWETKLPVLGVRACQPE